MTTPSSTWHAHISASCPQSMPTKQLAGSWLMADDQQLRQRCSSFFSPWCLSWLFPHFHLANAHHCSVNLSVCYLIIVIHPFIKIQQHLMIREIHGVPPFHSLVKQSSPLLSQKASVLHFLTPSCLSVGAPFLLISVVSTDGAASSQLDTAQPSYTSNQSKEQSIVCVVWSLSEQQTPACAQAAAQHCSS